jgi:hypothetical protein
MIRKLESYFAENDYKPGLVWALDRLVPNDPGPILASFTREMIAKYPIQNACNVANICSMFRFRRRSKKNIAMYD